MASVTRNPRPLFVTTLPAGYDGQEVFYQSTTAGTGGGATNSMADVGAVFHLRYRSASASAYKWEVVGASPIGMGVATEPSASLANNTYGVVNADSPKVTVPLAGNYNVSHTAVVLADSSANTPLDANVKINAATPGNTSYRSIQYQVPAAEYQTFAGQGPETFTAADALTQVYRQRSGGTKTVYRFSASLFITPIRVG